MFPFSGIIPATTPRPQLFGLKKFSQAIACWLTRRIHFSPPGRSILQAPSTLHIVTSPCLCDCCWYGALTTVSLILKPKNAYLYATSVHQGRSGDIKLAKRAKLTLLHSLTRSMGWPSYVKVNVPVHAKALRLDQNKPALSRNKFTAMEGLGIIGQSTSPWASFLQLVPKLVNESLVFQEFSCPVLWFLGPHRNNSELSRFLPLHCGVPPVPHMRAQPGL